MHDFECQNIREKFGNCGHQRDGSECFQGECPTQLADRQDIEGQVQDKEHKPEWPIAHIARDQRQTGDLPGEEVRLRQKLNSKRHKRSAYQYALDVFERCVPIGWWFAEQKHRSASMTYPAAVNRLPAS